MSKAEYVQFFAMLVGVVETYGGAYGQEPGLMKACLAEMKVTKPGIDINDSDKDDLKAAYTTCRDEYLTCMLLRGACHTRYRQLKNDLTNDIMKGSNNYPKSILDATWMLTKYKGAMRVHRIHDIEGNGMAFVQGGGHRKPKEMDTDNDAENCWHCGKPGHQKNRCPALMVAGIVNLNIADCGNSHGMFSAGNSAQECISDAQE